MADQIVDACCLINLYASGKFEEIISALGKLYVPEQVQRESLSIRQTDIVNPSQLTVCPIDLSGARIKGLIEDCRLESATEIASFVEFATKLDDGEASCLAIAKSRGWTVATDDHKAMRVAAESGISVITTPELIERWVTANGPARGEIIDILNCIERFASFRPRRSHPMYGWWLSFGQSVP